MKKNKLFHIFYIISFTFLLFWTGPSSAAQMINGLILSAETLEPLDSVRVTCFPEESFTYSNSDGSFSLSVCDFKDFDLQQKPYIKKTNSGFNGQVSSSDSPYYQLFDIKGRSVESYTLNLKLPALKSFNRAAGIYILESPDNSLKKIVVTEKTHLLPGLRKTENSSSLQLARRMPSCTISFSKLNYKTIDIPVHQISSSSPLLLREKRWVASDIHSHTVLTDGTHTFDKLAKYAFTKGGLDVLVNSEHGGAYARDTSGRFFSKNPVRDPDYPQFSQLSKIPRWYTLLKYSWPKLVGQRKLYPDKIILQGLEWNCPGYDHASVGFINDMDLPEAIAKFEYRFDYRDSLSEVRPDWGIKNRLTKNDALIALRWLNDNYPRSSYFFINHPSRLPTADYPVNEIRDFIAAAPEICLGFEGMPGHQKFHNRGKYNYWIENNDARTYGGADPILAHIGGVWDALLSEGHRFWTIANSDFHSTLHDFLPGEYTKTWSVVTDTGAQAWLDGIKSGEIFIVNGNLISALEFYIDDGLSIASMGDELSTNEMEVTLVIRFKSESTDKKGNRISVDHIDLICGTVSGKISPFDSGAYSNPKAPHTRIHSRFSSDSWIVDNGWYTISCLVDIEQPSYFRLRGTNLPVNTYGELDNHGNPLPDRPGYNSGRVALNDLWFYSNPIFVYPEDNYRY